MYSYDCGACGARTDSVHMRFTTIVRTGDAELQRNTICLYSYVLSTQTALVTHYPQTHSTATIICFIFVLFLFGMFLFFAPNFASEFGSISLEFRAKIP